MRKQWNPKRIRFSMHWLRQLSGLGVAAAVFAATLSGPQAAHAKQPRTFKRISHIPVYLNTSIDDETVAEIITASKDGKTLIYTDAATGKIGFIDISDPAIPLPLGAIDVGGEPTSVSVASQKYAIAGVNTSPSFTDPSGHLAVIDIASQTIVQSIDLGGQPDSVAVSKNGKYACIAIENERDEDAGNGEPPQSPPGFVMIVDMQGPPHKWKTRQVDLVGIPDLFPDDPEPEFVDINGRNIAVVTLQENNHIVLIDLKKGKVIGDFPAGTVSLDRIDATEDDIIQLTESLADVPREPDGVAWLTDSTFATADEGDLFGGSRGFTIFDYQGNVQYAAGEEVEYETARLGHYPEGRSENKGNEPENVEYGKFGGDKFMFVGSERASVVLVYKLETRIRKRPGKHWPRWWWGSYRIVQEPVFVQTLPAGIGPEGLLAIPQRGLFVTAAENDGRGDGFRSIVTLYKLDRSEPTYPTVVSDDDVAGTPIPWAALSGLAADPDDATIAYTIHDSFFVKSRIYSMDVSQKPAVITGQIVINDSSNLLKDALSELKATLPESATADFDVDALVNGDGTVNLDPEGIAVSPTGGFWIASEGTGNLVNGVSDPDNRPFESPNLLIKVDPSGNIVDVVLPPQAVTENQLRFGYEGVSAVLDPLTDTEVVYVCYQRAWTAAGDTDALQVRISRYHTTLAGDPDSAWETCYYNLDPRESPNGGWVGLSELLNIDDETFAVVERDNQANTDAAIKRIYSFSISGVVFRTQAEVDADPTVNFETVSKSLVRDILADLQVPGGSVLEKVEGMSVQADGRVLIVNDNDGVDDSNGETQLINLGPLFD